MTTAACRLKLYPPRTPPMRFVLFYHSLVSDWNHGNAHFLRGVVSELQARGHDVVVYEPRDSWSRQNLLAEDPGAVLAFHDAFPGLRSETYDPALLDLDAALLGADVVIAHEWSDPALVRRLGEHRQRSRGYVLLFHDTHHRAVTAPEEMAAYDLRHYDGVLAFGAVLRDLYLERRWARRAFVWHEAADTRRFFPLPLAPTQDLVWIGNFGDEERSAELQAYLIDPVRSLGLSATVHGVRYPEAAKAALRAAGIRYLGFLPNAEVPHALARARLTVHVPRRPYVERLPGIPTIRVFEALACGVPLVCTSWNDSEGLFTPGRDYLVAHDPAEMRLHLRALINEPELAAELRRHGKRTIDNRHTCAHRVTELLAVCAELAAEGAGPARRIG